MSDANRASSSAPTFLPFYHLLPEGIQRAVVHLPVGHRRLWQPFHLVSARQLREVLQAAQLHSVMGLKLAGYSSPTH